MHYIYCILCRCLDNHDSFFYIVCTLYSRLNGTRLLDIGCFSRVLQTERKQESLIKFPEWLFLSSLSHLTLFIGLFIYFGNQFFVKGARYWLSFIDKPVIPFLYIITPCYFYTPIIVTKCMYTYFSSNPKPQLENGHWLNIDINCLSGQHGI